MSVSKSLRKSARCPYYHKHGRDLRMASKYRDDGIDFHRYKQDYVDHLWSKNLNSDQEWARRWLGASGVSEDARRMVEWDLYDFSVDPDKIIGVEMFLVIDDHGKAIPGVPFPGYGKPPDHPKAFAHGTLDFVYTPTERLLVIDDYKTGWSPYVDREEAEHYAALAFAHFPGADKVLFRWVQVRIGSVEEIEFDRRQHERLITGIHNADSRIRAVESSEEPEANPYSGCCSWCHLDCPVRSQLPVGPIQNERDLSKAMGFIEATSHQLRSVRDMARSYVIETGPTEVAPGRVAQITPKERLEYPLRSTLAALGVQTPERVEEHDIDLDKLKVSSSELKRMAATKKRAGLQDALEPATRKKLFRELEVTESD